MAAADPWLANLEDFEKKWVGRLARVREVQFNYSRLVSEGRGRKSEPYEIADSFVAELGYQPIREGWREMKSASAKTEIADAISRDLVFTNTRLVDEEAAKRCASDFVNGLKADTRKLLTNRSGDHLMPISDWTLETAFVGFDNSKIALLLFRAED